MVGKYGIHVFRYSALPPLLGVSTCNFCMGPEEMVELAAKN
jgi:hypothetical protein